jgi:hypothetical protein
VKSSPDIQRRAAAFRWLVAALAVSAAFLLGWWLGRGETPPRGDVAPVLSATVRPEDVELRLDAGSVSLLPDGGGLHLRPLGAAGGSPMDMPEESE